MPNTPEKSSGYPALWQRLAILAVLGCLPSCDSRADKIDKRKEIAEMKRIVKEIMEGTERGEERENRREEAETNKPIPFCSQMRGLKVSNKPPNLHGRKKDSQVICMNDGDTFVSDVDGKAYSIRPWGHDCAETSRNKKCMKKGKKTCDREIKEGRRIAKISRRMLGNGKITLEPPYKNNGSRLLAYVRLENGTDFGRELVKKCLCKEGYTHKRKKDYQRAARRCR